MSEEIKSIVGDKELDSGDGSDMSAEASALNEPTTCDKEKKDDQTKSDSLSDKSDSIGDTATDYSLATATKMSTASEMPSVDATSTPTPPPQPQSLPISNKQPGQTKVISLDTIIRKGLSEQMPMTAKDIKNIVPNAIKNQMPSSSNAALIQQQLKSTISMSTPNKLIENVSTVTPSAKLPIDTKNVSVVSAAVTDAVCKEPPIASQDVDKPPQPIPAASNNTAAAAAAAAPAPAADEEDDDDYDDDYYDEEDNDDLIIEAKLREKAEQEARKSKANTSDSYLTDDRTSLKRKSLDLHDEDYVGEDDDDDDDEHVLQIDESPSTTNKKETSSEQLLEPMSEVPYDGDNITKMNKITKKSIDPKDAIEYYEEDDDDEEDEDVVYSDIQKNVGITDDQKSWHSYSDGESSESESMRTKRRRKSATNRDDDDDYSPTGNKKKKKLNAGAKRKPGRPKRDDIITTTQGTIGGFYHPQRSFIPQQQQPSASATNIIEPTPMDELISMGHSVFGEYNPSAAAASSSSTVATATSITTPSKRAGRRRKENFDEFFKDSPPEPHDLRVTTTPIICTTTDQISPSKSSASGSAASLTIEEKIAMGIAVPAADHLQLFRRKPGRPKIDKESGGHIVFQNSEVTLVNKVVGLKSHGQDSIDDNNQPQQQKLSKRMSGIEIVPITNRKSAQEYHDTAGLLMANQPIDDMLEVHHIEDYKEYDAEVKRRGGNRGNNTKQQDLGYNRNSGKYSGGIMTIIPSTSTTGNLQGRHRPIVETVKVEVHSSETQEQSSAPTVATTSDNNGQLPPTITNVVGKIRARRTSQLTEITKDVSAITTHTEQQRFKRMTTATKPKYYEWSENSNDNTDNQPAGQLTNSNVAVVAQKQRKPHWRTLQKQRFANRQKGIHWKTQQRLLNQERMKGTHDDGIHTDVDKNSETTQQTTAVDTSENISNTLPKIDKQTEKLSEITNNKQQTDDKSEQLTEQTDNVTTADAGDLTTSIDDDLVTKRKRIPKLKFGSYNFNERRDGSKPKMVLKYKKKYKRKPKKAMEQPLMLFAEGQPVEMLEPLADENEIQAPDEVIHHGPYPNLNEITPGKSHEYTHQIPQQLVHQQSTRKRPGPKPGWKLAATASTSPVAPTTITPITTSGRKKPGPKPKQPIITPTASKEFSKIPKRLSTSAVSVHDDDTESTATIGGDSTKRRRKVMIMNDEDGSSVSSLGSLTPNEIHEKLSKRYRTDSLADSECTDDIAKRYRVVKDRYKVLLDILEQRYSEIRDLKQRVNQLEKRDHDNDDVAGGSGVGSQMASATSSSIELVKKEEIDSGSWSNAELSKAYSLQKLSRPFYRYVQEKMLLPLPTIEVIEKYVDSIHMIRGLLPNMLQILEYDSETMTDIDRVTVLQISQIKTATIYEYDKAMDKILGPHQQLIVIVARGLYSSWSQAVYIDFDVVTFKSCIKMIIEELHKIKYPVVACVCNYNEAESENIWTELGVSMGCNYFAHPITTEFIYAFYYVDDLLAELGHQFCTNGFVGDLGKISVNPLKQLLNDNTSTAKLRLTMSMLDAMSSLQCVGDGVTKSIDCAKEIFTHETANLIKLCQSKDLEAISCGNFIEIICSFAKIMSSNKSLSINDLSLFKSPSDTTTDQQQNIEHLPYGISLELQNQVLSEIQLNFYRLRLPGVVTKISGIQRAIMMMIESLKMLQHSTKQKYKMDGIPTAHITTDDFRCKLNAIKRRHKNYDEVIAPLQGFAFIKEIFLQCNAGKLQGNNINVIDDSTAISASRTASTSSPPPPPSSSSSSSVDNQQQSTLHNDYHDRLFYDEPIDIAQPESHYVKHLLVWLIKQHKIKHPHSVVNDEDLLKRFQKFDDTFQTMQNPHFQICDGAFVKVLKKLKTHNYGMSFEMLNLFVVQRHLLRIKYLNEIGITNLNGSKDDKKQNV